MSSNDNDFNSRASSSAESPILIALREHNVMARVADFDHYRIHGGMAVETDYIITVSPKAKPGTSRKLSQAGAVFDRFMLSKSYSAFRSFAAQLKRAADVYTTADTHNELPTDAVKTAKYCELVSHLIESQRTTYLGKVNYNYVKLLAKQRSQLINDVLEATCTCFPVVTKRAHPLLGQVTTIIELFFLTDHCEILNGGTNSAESSPPTTLKPELSRRASFSKAVSAVASNLPNPFSSSSSSNKNQTDDTSLTNSTTLQQSASITSSKRSMGGSVAKSTSSSRLSSISAHVIPLSRRLRRSDLVRKQDDQDLNDMGKEARLMLDEGRSSSVTNHMDASARSTASLTGGVQPSTTKVERQQSGLYAAVCRFLENNPIAFAAITAGALIIFQRASSLEITIDGDVALLCLFSTFCLGWHMPRLDGGGTAAPVASKSSLAGGTRHSTHPRRSSTGSQMGDRSGRRLLKRLSLASPTTHHSRMEEPSLHDSALVGESSAQFSIAGDDLDDDEESFVITGSPMPEFPEGAPIGSHTHCWSEPHHSEFKVRGSSYFADKKKIKSDNYLFKSRGMDLFLTDTCPENVGSNGSILGGNLRDTPTFLINFRLPWGVVIFYFEIPERFVPFVRACYEPDYDRTTLPSLASMSSGERATCRWLLEDEEYKNRTLKVVPVVVDGPWVVRQVVGGTPAIIGNKIPMRYIYQKATKSEDGADQALYLEADLDIAASSAARYILSVARSYTDALTLDLGFVVQGNRSDELPEQMLTGTRMHRLEILTAPSLPPMKNLFLNVSEGGQVGNAESGDFTEFDFDREQDFA